MRVGRLSGVGCLNRRCSRAGALVAALASDSVEVVDLREGRRVERITSLHEPQGVLYLARHRCLLVANGTGGGVQAFIDGKSLLREVDRSRGSVPT